MPKEDYPKEFLDLCRSVTAKRPKTVITHILKHGQITTEELKNLYGYNHPPRAARDVKEHGIPIERVTVVGTDGRKIAAYRFGDTTNLKVRRFDGRTGLSKQIKDALITKYGCRCFIYLEEMPEAALQIDHRVPFEVAGESEAMLPEDFMLLCGSANSAKNWFCSQCDNWRDRKDREVCLTCYWAYPDNHTHVAMKQLRRVDLLWQGDETQEYERLKADAAEAGMAIPDFVKEVLRKAVSGLNQ
ncbi:MAG TPA: HNH endonuclease [Verrucomicrobiales bacterium]|nr:HNH endonuclease [Verrucomicrobiales bacterium]